MNEHIFSAPDGQTPAPTLATDGTNVFGVTRSAGANNQGTVYEIAPDGTITTLYSFGAATDSNGNNTDGTSPQAAPLLAPDGFLYGTTTSGGADGNGTVYRLNPATGALTTLASFSSDTTGYYCVAPLVTDGRSLVPLALEPQRQLLRRRRIRRHQRLRHPLRLQRGRHAHRPVQLQLFRQR